MTKEEKKEYKLLMLEALDILIIPRLEEMGKDIKGLKGDASGLKKDMTDVKEELIDVHATTNRIETLVKSEIKYVDALDARVVSLEKSKA